MVSKHQETSKKLSYSWFKWKTCSSSNFGSEPSRLFQIQLDGLQIPVFWFWSILIWMGNIKITFINQETIIAVSICISPSIHSMIYKGKQWVSQVNFFKLSFGDEFDCNGTMWIHLDLIHVLETKFQSREVRMMF